MKKLKAILLTFILTLCLSTFMAEAGQHMLKVGHFSNISVSGFGGTYKDTRHYLENEWGYTWIYDSSTNKSLNVRLNEYSGNTNTIQISGGYKTWNQGAEQVEVTNAASPATLQIMVGNYYGLEFKTNLLDFTGTQIYYGDWWLDTRD